MIGVYVARDRDGQVLYVGASTNIDTRLNAHRTSSPWWAEVDSVEQIEADNRMLARHRERELIASLDPIWNRMSRGGPKPKNRSVGPIVRPRPEALASLIETFGSVAALAAEIGCNSQTVSDVWRGSHYPSSKVIARLIVVTGIPFDELFYIEASDIPVDEWFDRRPRKGAAA